VRESIVEIVLVGLAGVVAVLAFASLLPRCSGGGSGSSRPVLRASWALTPGVLNPDVTQATIRSTICRSGFTRTIRPPVGYTNELKLKGLVAYHLRGPPSAFQEDHLISLELGGSPDDPRNLWPEPYPRASAVDQIENELNAQVCGGTLSLHDAQEKESALKHSQG
jgi:hypothetical protein